MRSNIRPMPTRLAPALLLVGALVLAACTGAGTDTGATATSPTETTQAAASPTETAPATTNAADTTAAATGTPDDSITVTTVDYMFENLPAKLRVGDRLQLQNVSERELHELVAVRLPDDEQRSVEELVTSDMEVLFSVPPTMVLAAPPGGEQVTVLGDGTFTEPGRYAVVCVIPTGVDPEVYLEAAAQSGNEPPQIPDAGPPHVAHGMHAEVIVE